MRYLCSGFEAILKRKSAYAVPVQRIWCESEHMQYLCSGFEIKIEAKVSKCGTCAADLVRKSPYAVPVQRISSDFAAKVSKCGTCAADLMRMSPYAVPVQRIWVKTGNLRQGRGNLWGAGKTRIFIESERFA